MSLPLPSTLSPSKVTAFKQCGLAFRLSAIDRIPEPPSAAATKGTLVHRALQLLMHRHDPGSRSRAAAAACLDQAVADVLAPDLLDALSLHGEALDEFVADARSLVEGLFRIEDPDAVTVVGTELMVSAEVQGLQLRGIIDRLELDADGGLVVTDYKTGRAPGATTEQARMLGVHFYALLCEAAFGQRPVRVQLLHLREPVAISMTTSDQSVAGMRLQTAALWAAVESACERGDFQPRPGPACSWCGYRAHCPAVGGSLPTLAGAA